MRSSTLFEHITADLKRDWPELRELGARNDPQVERLRDYLDFKIVDSAFKEQAARERDNLEFAHGSMGSAAAFQLVRLALFGGPPSEARIEQMGTLVAEGKRP